MRTHLLVGAGLLALAPITGISASREAKPSCSASLWSHVYDPSRLTIINRCISVTGTVAESSRDDDGDQHFLVKLDPGQDRLLKKRNMTKKAGNLVAEIVCANKVKLKRARAACSGFSNPVALPTVGSHVTVTGSYVIDTHNGWAEIDPVSQVQ